MGTHTTRHPPAIAALLVAWLAGCAATVTSADAAAPADDAAPSADSAPPLADAAVDAPADVAPVAPTPIIQLALGPSHACVVLADGTVRCWGDNRFGEVGDGSTVIRPRPTPVAGLTDAVEVALGEAHSCARLRDGTVRCWGYRGYGRLGAGPNPLDVMAPPVVGLSDVTALAAGTTHTCALTRAGRGRCWGTNFRGPLGNGTTETREVPTPVRSADGAGELTGVVGIAAHFQTTCARFADGTVACWGANFGGLLGPSVTDDHSALPVPIAGVARAATIGVGFGHACALRDDGAVLCWGSNDQGQSNGRRNDPATAAPTAVAGVADAVGLALGDSYTCVRNRAGVARCWGVTAHRRARRIGPRHRPRRAARDGADRGRCGLHLRARAGPRRALLGLEPAGPAR